MNFVECINDLYFGDIQTICNRLNQAKHLFSTGVESICVYTGFYCKLQTGSLFCFLYDIKQHELFYMKSQTTVRLPLGLPVAVNTFAVESESIQYYKTFGPIWFDEYDPNTDSFHPALICKATTDNDQLQIYIEGHKTPVNSFKVINKTITTEYPIFRQPTPLIFKDLDSFSPCNYALLSSYHARHPFSEDVTEF